MNIYFLVEGRRTEKKVYPKWLNYLLPELQETKDAFSVDEKKFYLFNGNGYPSILNHLQNAVADINHIGKYNYLVMCIDADDVGVAYRTQEVLSFMQNEEVQLIEKTKFVLIIQNRCIETWCLGNQRIFKRNPASTTLKQYIEHYDVSKDDPEQMGKIEHFSTYAQFHAEYLKALLAERNISYTKRNPKAVIDKPYLLELIDRISTTQHLPSFKHFIDFCEKVKKEMDTP